METLLYILVALVALAALLCLTVITVAGLLYIRTVLPAKEEWIPEAFLPKGSKTPIPFNQVPGSSNQYTPLDNVNSKVPLDQFTPNFKKPIKFVIEEDDDGVEEKQYVS